MAQSSSYAKSSISDSDLFFGSKFSTNKTTNYSASELVSYLNSFSKISIAGQLSYTFFTNTYSAASIFFSAGGGNNTAFSAITELIVSENDLKGVPANFYLNYLVGNTIIIAKQSEHDVFGHYVLSAFAADVVPGFYKMTLSFVGGNGNITNDTIYDVANLTLVNSLSIPNLQQVTDVGNVTTNVINALGFASNDGFGGSFSLSGAYFDMYDSSGAYFTNFGSASSLFLTDAAGNSFSVNANIIDLVNPLGTSVNISSSGVSLFDNILVDAWTLNYPIKPNGYVGTFAMLDDVPADQDLQSVTNLGNETITTLVSKDATQPASYRGTLSKDGLYILQGSNFTRLFNAPLFQNSELEFNSGDGRSVTLGIESAGSSRITDFKLPNKPTGTYILATTSDTPTAQDLPSVLAQGNRTIFEVTTAYTSQTVDRGRFLFVQIGSVVIDVDDAEHAIGDELDIQNQRTNGLLITLLGFAQFTDATNTVLVPPLGRILLKKQATNSWSYSIINNSRILYLENILGSGFGSIMQVADTFEFVNGSGNLIYSLETAFLNIFKTVGIGGKLSMFNLTDYRQFEFPDADGTIALISDIPSLTGYVPYTGATADVNLGEFGLLTGNIEFDNTPTNIPTSAGSMCWNDSDGTVDLILKGGNVKLQVGQEQVIRVVNKTATNINLLEANYQAVRVTGAQGQRLKVDLAQATNDLLSAETIGLVTETINNNQEGFITTSGLVRNINTTGSLQGETWADGDILYLSPTTAGMVTKVKPVAPNHLVIIGYVVHAHITQGSIFVKVDNGYELDELHNVKIDTPLNNQALVYNSSLQIWENKPVTIKVNPVTLIIASWTLVGIYYEYTYANANILSASTINFVPNNASNLEVTSCKMLPQIDVSVGSCKFYSMFPPQSDIVGELTIQI